jgi:hypothetical protein
MALYSFDFVWKLHFGFPWGDPYRSSQVNFKGAMNYYDSLAQVTQGYWWDISVCVHTSLEELKMLTSKRYYHILPVVSERT